jgi:hypothetical protein
MSFSAKGLPAVSESWVVETMSIPLTPFSAIASFSV